jgi:ethanolamine utilization protein EutP (predicted NTPase)
VSGLKPHILVLNKKDLADMQMKLEIEAILRKDGSHVLFTNCKDSKCPGVKQVGSRVSI